MGRPSKLTNQQWETFERRLLVGGERLADLCREFGVTKQSASARFAGRKEKVKEVADQIVTANRQLMNLDINGQKAALDLAQSLIAISENMACAAVSGSYTSMRLNHIAAMKVKRIDPESPESHEEDLKVIAALTRTGNMAAEVGMNLLNANKDRNKQQTTATLENLVLGITDGE